MITTLEERVAFDMYFSTITGFQQHPGAGTKDHKVKSLLECRDLALEMLKIRQQLFEVK